MWTLRNNTTRKQQPEIVLGFPQNSNNLNFPKRSQQTVSWKDGSGSQSQTPHTRAWRKAAGPKKKRITYCQEILSSWFPSKQGTLIHTHYLKYDFDLLVLGCKSWAQDSRPAQGQVFRDNGQEHWKAALPQENQHYVVLQKAPGQTTWEWVVLTETLIETLR